MNKNKQAAFVGGFCIQIISDISLHIFLPIMLKRLEILIIFDALET